MTARTGPHQALNRRGVDAGLPQLDQALVSAVFEDAPDGIVIVDDSGAMVVANRRMEELFGYRREELLGESVELLVPEAARSAHAAQRARYAGTPSARPMGAGLQLAGRRRDGTDLPVEISLSPVATGTGRFTVAMVRDISERVRAEEELRQAHEELALLDDRERIARDLHDTVLQRIFATGLTVQAASMRTGNPDARQRLEAAVTELDTAIREIRTAIFGLHGSPPGGSLRESVIGVAGEAARALGFRPAVHFEGPVDSVVSGSAADELVAVAREALSNVARHAHATRVDVTVKATDRDVVLTVADDGCGVPAGADRSGGRGLANMAQRARSLGGRCDVSSPEDAGTVVSCRIPVGQG